MKINFIVPEITRNGGIRVIFEFANRLTSKGHEVKLYSRIIPLNPFKTKVKPYYLKYQIKNGMKYLIGRSFLPSNIYDYNFKIKFVHSLNNLFIDDADAVIATAWTTAYPVNKLNQRKGRKFYLVQDYENWNANVKYVDQSYKLPLTKIVIAKHLKDFLKNKFGVDSTVISIGIDLRKFNNPDKQFKYPYRILFLEHQLENKNSVQAIKICEKLKKKNSELKFRAFGLSSTHNLPDFIEFFENPDGELLNKIYCESDIFLYPTLREGYSLTPVEAMACKCALVANAAAAIPEYCTQNENAVLCNPEKPEELFNGIQYLIDNPNELERISLAGYERIKSTFDWERSVNQLEQLLNQ